MGQGMRSLCFDSVTATVSTYLRVWRDGKRRLQVFFVI